MEEAHNLGLTAIDTVCDYLGDDAVVVVLALALAFPKQWNARVDENPKGFIKAPLKLMSYYARGSFIPVLSGGLMLSPWIRN